jgi:hypothetical protein
VFVRHLVEPGESSPSKCGVNGSSSASEGSSSDATGSSSSASDVKSKTTGGSKLREGQLPVLLSEVVLLVGGKLAAAGQLSTFSGNTVVPLMSGITEAFAAFSCDVVVFLAIFFLLLNRGVVSYMPGGLRSSSGGSGGERGEKEEERSLRCWVCQNTEFQLRKTMMLH